MGLDGPAREIIVEPITAPAPPAPDREREPPPDRQPAEKPAKEPAPA
jgi:hypothetical protein